MMPAPSRVLDLERATLFLTDMNALLDAATPAQQRALMQQVFMTIWIEKGAVTAIRPAHSYALLVEAMWAKRSRLESTPRQQTIRWNVGGRSRSRRLSVGGGRC
jgi:hypothetical protein